MRPSIPQVFAAVPDTITTATFATAWVAPALLGAQWVRNLMLTMLIEFLVIHASGMSGGIAGAHVSRLKRGSLWVLLGAVYMLFVVLFSWIFGSIWPIFAFGWLLLSRFTPLLSTRVQSYADAQRMITLWVQSGITYIFGAILTAVIPLPAFGLTPDAVAVLRLPGSGVWVEHPQSVLAFGTLYFAVQAWLKYVAAKN